MADILLLEPNYKNKYPPLSLMKLSYYHRNIKNDYVMFAKGTLPEVFKNKKWDRVYVTTLFTFEWTETIKAINYAKTVAKNQDSIYIGGIAATLMPDEFEKETGIRPITGQLNEKGKLGYEDDDIIDTITPDYKILQDVEYIYPYANAYFMYTTKGCGMKCEFCAVQKLEPKFVPQICITKQIVEINSKFGEKKDLVLMDNNVLKSPMFHLIIDEIKTLGFVNGAMFRSPLSGKMVKRFVDFNQGLDAFLLSDDKAKKLAELAIRPARIAFDHIEDKDTYETAIRRCAKYGITKLSNYILYNSDAFTGKGRHYNADTPEDLYERLKFTIDLQDDINKALPEDNKISVFSFPMRYIPLNAKKRGYIGSRWNAKYLRAIQCMLLPTQGKGVSNRPFLEVDLGKDLMEYMKILAMPEEIMASRGRFVENKVGLKDESDEQRIVRKKKWGVKQSVRIEWERLYNQINEHMDDFINLIRNNRYSVVDYFDIEEPLVKKIYLHYFSLRRILSVMDQLDSEKEKDFFIHYCTVEFPVFLERLSEYIYQTKLPYSVITGYIRVFGEKGLRLLLISWIKEDYQNDYFIDMLEKAMDQEKSRLLSIRIIRFFKYYKDMGILDNEEIEKAKKHIVEFKVKDLGNMLINHREGLEEMLYKINDNSLGQEIMRQKVKLATNQILSEIEIEIAMVCMKKDDSV